MLIEKAEDWIQEIKEASEKAGATFLQVHTEVFCTSRHFQLFLYTVFIVGKWEELSARG